MKMSPSRVETVRRAIRWFPLTAIVALVPKCLLCLAAYAGGGAAFGLTFGGPEICGASTGFPGSAMVWYALLGAVVILGLICRSMTSGPHQR